MQSINEIVDSVTVESTARYLHTTIAAVMNLESVDTLLELYKEQLVDRGYMTSEGTIDKVCENIISKHPSALWYVLKRSKPSIHDLNIIRSVHKQPKHTRWALNQILEVFKTRIDDWTE